MRLRDRHAPAGPAPGLASWPPWVAPVVLIAVAFAAYANSLRGPLVFDDIPAVVQNLSIRDVQNLGAVFSPPEEGTTAGRPLLNLSFALNYKLGRTDVLGYHLANLALHLAAGLALFGLVRRTLLTCTGRWREEADGMALAVAGVWLVHPLHTATITYISQRAEAMMGLAYLLTLYALARGAPARRENGWTWLSVAACAVGMLCKETMITAPVLVLLFDRTFFAGTFAGALARRRRYYLALALTWVPLFLLMWQTRLTARGVGFEKDVGPWDYAMTETRVVLDYLKLAIWPDPLVFDYGPQVLVRSLAAVWPQALAVGALLAATAVALRRAPAIGFLSAAVFIVLAPTSSVVPVIHQPMAENRMYLPLAFVIALAVAGLWRVARKRGRWGAWPLLLGAAMALGAMTVRRNEDFRSELRLWRDTVAKNPGNARAHGYYGEALRAAGETARAEQEFLTALRIRPNYAPPHNNLGVIYMAAGRFTDALAHYEAAARLLPGNGPVHNNIGTVLERIAGREAEALEHYREAVRLSPTFADAHRNLAGLLWRRDQKAEALAAYAAGVEARPDDAGLRAALGFALTGVGRLAEAAQQGENALRLDPQSAIAHLYYAHTLRRLGRPAEALAHYRRAIELQPDSAEAWLNLGLLLSGIPGEREAAATALRNALTLRPDLPVARATLERLEKK